MNSVVLKIIFLFLVAQAIGIYAGVMISNDVNTNPYAQAFIITENTQDPVNALYFFAYILIGAVIFIFLMRLYFAEFLFKLIELFLIMTSSSIVFYTFFRLYYGYELSMITGILLGILLGAAKFFLPYLKNATTILAAAGVGVIFGISLGVVPVVLFLVLLSIYDYLAVFKTGHMVKMADFIMKKNLSFTITASEVIPETKKEARMDLGSGDVLAPIMFEVSALQISPVASLMVFLGAGIFLFVFLFLVWKRKVVLPALPPIVAGMILFLLAGKLMAMY